MDKLYHAPRFFLFQIKLLSYVHFLLMQQVYFSGIKSFNIDLEKGQVIVESSLGSENVKSLIEKSGRRAVLKGMGGGKYEY